jgi:uncharacterized protein YcaQ
MKYESISLKEAQNLFLSGQKLTSATLTPLEIIEHLGYVQIDTISVIERAHHHVFWTRNQNYRPTDLDELVKSRKVFEHWSHAASYLPMNEYRFSLPMKAAFQKKSWLNSEPKLLLAVVEKIRNEGALRSKDFENSKKGKTGWWDWKPAKRALEQLFLEGRLEITRREGFQKVYDLPERVIPSSVNTTMPSDTEYVQYLIDRTLRHHGLASVNEIAYLQKKDIKTQVTQQLANLLEEGKIIQVKVEKNEESYFTTFNSLNNIIKPSSKVFIFSPFDNLIIQRKKLSAFFNFEYKIECYLPASKRKYGYFCLPIFIGSQAVARIDCKAYRKEQKFVVNSIHYEKGVNKDSPHLQDKLKSKLKAFAEFNGSKLDF